MRASVCVFPSYLQHVGRNPTSATASLSQRREFARAYLGLEHLGCRDVPDLHIHERLHEYMFVRMLGCMSTMLYVYVTHTQHTHTRAHNTHTCLGLYACII